MTESIKRQLILTGILMLAAFAASIFVIGIIGIVSLLGGITVTLDPGMEKLVLMVTMTASAATLLMFCIFLKEYYKFKDIFEKEGIIEKIMKRRKSYMKNSQYKKVEKMKKVKDYTNWKDDPAFVKNKK